MTEQSVNSNFSLVPRQPQELSIHQRAQNRILSEMIASSLSVAKELSRVRDIMGTVVPDDLEAFVRVSKHMERRWGETESEKRLLHAIFEKPSWYRKAAEEGDPDSQNNLAICYYNGSGKEIPPDYFEAASWFRKAAEQGYIYAQINTAHCYALGRGVPQNYVEAVNWYRKAAAKGNTVAQMNLGACYWKGEGVAQNHMEAANWFSKVAEQGDSDAQRWRRSWNCRPRRSWS